LCTTPFPRRRSINPCLIDLIGVFKKPLLLFNISIHACLGSHT
jgi:hypothetical protein